MTTPISQKLILRCLLFLVTTLLVILGSSNYGVSSSPIAPHFSGGGEIYKWPAKVKTLAKKTYGNMTRQHAVGFGGRYGKLRNILSEQNQIESDHFPPKSVYSDARDSKIRALAETDMGAVTLAHPIHRDFITTGSSKKTQEFVESQKALFRKGDYAEAISKNIEWYRTNPSPDSGANRPGFLDDIKQGLVDALDVHVANGLINSTQKGQIMDKHLLNGLPPVTDPFRTHIRHEVLTDTEKYAKKMAEINRRMCRKRKLSIDHLIDNLKRLKLDPQQNSHDNHNNDDDVNMEEKNESDHDNSNQPPPKVGGNGDTKIKILRLTKRCQNNEE